MSVKFGSSGNPDSFYAAGYKSSVQMPGYLRELGLDSYEYQCGKGIHIKEESARRLGQAARDCGITLTLHAPYFISLASPKEEVRENSIRYILDSLRCADWMGAERIVVHSGGVGKFTREEALYLAKDTLKKAADAQRSEGLGHVHICPETMGKINQLGDEKEVAELCLVDESFLPTIDFGHLNARTHGGLQTESDFIAVLRYFIDRLGMERMRNFHCHFSRIAYTDGGEKCHLTFHDDAPFGPDYRPFLSAVCRLGLEPYVTCESAGTQALDALTMKKYYLELCGTV